MWSVLSTAWRIVIRRAISDRLILLAAAITILAATMLVASGPIYADAVTLSAVQRTLADADVDEANVSISTRVSAATFTATNNLVNEQVARSLALTGFNGERRGTSESYSLPIQPGDEVTNLVVFRYFGQIEEHVTVVDGLWPTVGGAPHEVALPEPAALTLGLAVDDQLELTNRRDNDVRVTVRISGIYQINDPRDPFWFGDELDLSGRSEGASFVTFGPLVVPFDTFFQTATPVSSKFDWRIFPNHENLAVADIREVRDQLAGMQGRLNVGREAGNQMLVETELIDILDDTQRSLLVTRSTMLIMTVQFSLLAGYALLLTAGLLAESRQVEIALLRSRGAGSRQVLAMALMEGALLVVPAALAAPGLAAFTLRAFNHVGPLADIELTISPRATGASFLIAGIVAAGCLVALTIPTFRSARSFGAVQVERSREMRRGLAQRARLDLALLAIAGIALWQLQRYGAPITETVEGRLGIDPLLVAAPTLGLLAGGVVALRALPLLSLTAEAVMSDSRRLVPVLGAWQVARRPRRYARIALFLMMAVGIGFFTVAYASTWQASQSDRAAYDIGADLRHDRNRLFDPLPAHVLSDAYDDLPGFEAAMPVLRESGRLARSSTNVRYVILDSARAAATITFRSDLSETPIDELMAPLAAGRYRPATIPLSGTPTRLAIDMALVVEPFPEGFIPPSNIPEFRLRMTPSFRVVLIDADGQLLRFDLGRVKQNGGLLRLTTDLDHRLDNGQVLQPAYPLAIVAFELRSGIPRQVVREATLTISGIHVVRPDESSGWQELPEALDPGDWTISVSKPRLSIVAPDMTMSPDTTNRLELEITSGATAAPGAVPSYFGMRPRGSPSPDTIPVLVSSDLLAELDLEIGEEIPLVLPGFDGRGLITGAIRDFPTIDPLRGEAVVLDYQTYLTVRYEAGSTMPAPDEMWLSIEDGSLDSARAILTEKPFSSAVLNSFSERERTLQNDPVARGTIGSLFLGFVAAAVLTGVGFAVNAAVSARERLAEFALLRAAGLSNRQLLGWLSLENAVLVGFGLVAGTALGALLVWFVLPLTTLTQDATTAVPDVLVVYPWRTIFWFEAGVVGALVAAVATLGVVLKRSGLEAILRAGGE